MGFCFTFLGSYIFISDHKVKAKSNINSNCILSSPWESQLPVQIDTYIDELVEIFLKLSMKTVQVHLIIGTTLVSNNVFSEFGTGKIRQRILSTSLRNKDVGKSA